MGDELVSTVLDRATADTALSEAAGLLVLAALEGPEHLATALGPAVPGTAPGKHARPDPATGAAADRPGGDDTADRTGGDDTADPALAEPTRAYLSAVRVTGFRGIGATSTLRITPGPGLTVVAGRNGCGKSSFAEALEVVFTRNSYRWKRRPPMWSESWRNLHHPGPTSVVVELAEEGPGTATVAAEWDPGTPFDAARIWYQRRGRKRGDLADLGWTDHLERHRPFLSYDELGALFAAEPSKLHDVLAGFLGLDRLDDAIALLNTHAKDLARPAESARRLARDLLPALAASPDPRAAEAASLVRAKRPDLARAARLATGTATPAPALARLRALAELPLPDPDRWHRALSEIQQAATEHRATSAAAEAPGRAATSLLRAALEHRTQHGPGPCPVCGVGTLDDTWAANAGSVLAEVSTQAAAAELTAARLTAARDALRQAVPPPPAVLAEPAAAGAVPATATARDAWQRLQETVAAVAAPDLAASGHGAPDEVTLDLLGDLHAQVATAVHDVRRRAAAALTAAEGAWQPLAVRLAEWLTHARTADGAAATLAEVKQAHAWLRDNAADLRNARLAPLAERAREIWSLLRQESNVDLGALTLASSATRRHVKLHGTVDGEPVGAFGVMSQGELHALALALFLPRATAADSPFGFLVIDDPVQAMDPAKVDGLARVLARTAEQRQVVVFTHDDRLPEAVRRLRIDARVLEVTRDAGSAVMVTESSDPARRYLDDARAIASDRAVTGDVEGRVIATLCRFAVEATCRDVYFRRRLLAGAPRSELERTWSGVTRTRARLALALHGSAGASIDGWLTGPRWDALRLCTEAVHTGSPRGHRAVDAVQRLIDDLKQT